jgi:uncharacterized protein (DUF1697 family)
LPAVVFLRGVNVGGHKAFRPSVLAGQLAPLDVVSVGAAGTFVVHGAAAKSAIRSAFQKRLPFDAHLMICTARDVIGLIESDPFSDGDSRKADGQFISVLESRPRTRLPLPLHVPEGSDWQVGVTAIHGCFVASLFRRVGKNFLYPNEVVEKRLGVAATTRGWPTILKLGEILRAESAPSAPAAKPRDPRKPPMPRKPGPLRSGSRR